MIGFPALVTGSPLNVLGATIVILTVRGVEDVTTSKFEVLIVL